MWCLKEGLTGLNSAKHVVENFQVGMDRTMQYEVVYCGKYFLALLWEIPVCHCTIQYNLAPKFPKCTLILT